MKIEDPNFRQPRIYKSYEIHIRKEPDIICLILYTQCGTFRSKNPQKGNMGVPAPDMTQKVN